MLLSSQQVFGDFVCFFVFVDVVLFLLACLFLLLRFIVQVLGCV